MNIISPNKKDILLIDNNCTLCSKSVAFIIQHGGDEKYHFVSLYSEEGKFYLVEKGFPDNYTQSIVLIRESNVYTKSDAVLEITRNLNGLFPYLYGLKIVPKFIRDAIYNLVAKHRHRIFK